MADFCMAAFLFTNIVVLATFNNDWEGYEREYDTLKEVSDYGWYTAVLISRSYGLSYTQFYMIIQSFIGLSILLTTKFFYGKEYTLVMLFVLCLLMPNLSILIRYYLAFSLFLLCLICYCKNRRIIAVIIGVISFTVHSGIVLIYLVFLFKIIVSKYECRIQKLIKLCLIFSVLLFVLQTFLFNILDSLGLSVFSIYKDVVSSAQSAIFMLVMYYLVFMYAIILSKWMLNTQKDLSIQHMMLITANLYTLPFISLSKIQIIFFRLYEPLLLLSFISILQFQYNFFNKYKKGKGKNTDSFPLGIISNASIFIVFFLVVSLKYYIMGLFTGGSEWLYYYRDIILSNENSILFYVFK